MKRTLSSTALLALWWIISLSYFPPQEAHGSIANGIIVYCPDTSGAANTITCSTVSGFGGYIAGQSVDVLVANSATAATIININALGAKAVTYNGTTVIVSGILTAGATYRLTYDGTRFVVQGHVSNPGTLPVSVYIATDSTGTGIASNAATSPSTVAIGQSSSAGGATSVAVGKSASAAGLAGVAVGLSASAAGVAAIAIGDQSSGTTTESIAIGFQAVASAAHAISMGDGTTNSTANSFNFGTGGALFMTVSGDGVVPTALAFALLGTPTAITLVGCTDCTVTSGVDNTCKNGGTGSLAVRLNGAWKCFQ